MAEVTFASVSKQFGNVRAVDDVTLTIADGEFVCLLGPSGCGKTTTLRLIAGLEHPTSGRIVIGQRDVTSLGPKERDIGMVFQDYALYPHMTIAENIAYPLKVRGVRSAERHDRAEEVAARLQIETLLDRRPAQVSGGQQQRTSVARALVHKPQVFLFDEPLSNLDAKLRLEARSFLKHLQRQLGVTAVYVTHDQAEAMALADRIAVMEGGRIVQQGPPLDVYRKPATTFVAGFLGNPPMNLLSVRFERRNGDAELIGTAFRFDVSALARKLEQKIADGDELVLGLRPEHLDLCREAEPWALPGEVFAVEPLGPETLITVTIGGQLATARIFSDEPPSVSGSVFLRVRPERLHLFRNSGERLADW